MKNLTKRMTFAAATLIVAAGVAGAQNMKAEVPFGFRLTDTVMPAGAYVLNATYSSGVPIFKLTNDVTHQSVLTVPYTNNSQKPGEASASFTFECTDHDCVLIRVAPGSGQSYQIWKPKIAKGEATHLTVIRAVLGNAR
jgi:hypothetical protein